MAVEAASTVRFRQGPALRESRWTPWIDGVFLVGVAVLLVLSLWGGFRQPASLLLGMYCILEIARRHAEKSSIEILPGMLRVRGRSVANVPLRAISAVGEASYGGTQDYAAVYQVTVRTEGAIWALKALLPAILLYIPVRTKRLDLRMEYEVAREFVETLRQRVAVAKLTDEASPRSVEDLR